tara:strand:+ start:277 stop:378 length:102 start_codon:yes stop_codon:yes gene_type:complete
MGIIGIITVFGVGVALGMYVASQIERHVDNNTK